MHGSDTIAAQISTQLYATLQYPNSVPMWSWYFTPYTIPLLLTAATSGLLILYVRRYQNTPGADPLSALLLAVSVWSLGYALELGSASLATKIFWSNVAYVGIVTVPVAWLVFSAYPKTMSR